MPDPLVSADVDLRGLPWMRLDTVRLLDSDLFALSSGDEFKAAVALWCKSWGQVPAGSLPTDDRILAHLSGAGSRWKKLKTMALRGWVTCSDGRMYHPVVAEQVLAAWDERVEFRERVDGQNERQRRAREEKAAMVAELKAAGVTLAWNATMTEVRAAHASLSRPVTVTGGNEKRDGHSDCHGLDGTGRDGTVKALTETPQRAERYSGLVSDMARSLRANGFPACSDTHPDLATLAEEGATAADVLEAAIAAGGKKPLGWVVSRVRGRRAEAAAGGQAAGGVAIVIDQTAARRARARHTLDDDVLKARNDCELGIISADERDGRIEQAHADYLAEWGPDEAVRSVA